MGSRVLDFLIRRDDWHKCRFAESPPPELEPGDVLFRVDRFAFTSNNVTYAAVGDMLDYWGFFPADPGWGRLPAMGFADVAASRHPEVAEGERVFGFFPMSSHLRIRADAVGPTGFVDAAPHRSGHAPVYRQYTRVATDPSYDAGHEDGLALLRGLFLTSFLVDDFLAENDHFGARRCVISSASSKTAIALAFQLAQRSGIEAVGLTSPRHLDFVAGLGRCDRVLPYAEIASLAQDVPTVFVDHSGDGEVVDALHRHLADRLLHSCIVGATHWGAGPRSQDLPGAEPTFFFAPSQIVKRSQEWGPAELQRRLGAGLREFLDWSDGWLEVVHGRGPAEVERSYLEVLEGRALPHQGHVLSLAEPA
jgi:hypothetical protein